MAYLRLNHGVSRVVCSIYNDSVITSSFCLLYVHMQYNDNVIIGWGEGCMLKGGGQVKKGCGITVRGADDRAGARDESALPPTGGSRYQYMDDLMGMDACRSNTPTRLPEGMEQVESPLDWQEWDHCLAAHPDQQFRHYIVEGIRRGFRVGFDARQGDIRSSSNNMLSAREHPEIVNEYLARECGAGRVLGPLDPSQFPQVHTSPFGVIPKSSGGWRLIVDLSSPKGSSVNDGVSKAQSSLSYVSIHDAAKGIALSGRETLLAKVDVKSAYRNVPVHPEDRWLLGMRWQGALFIDTVLPFGLRSAPKIFTAIADAAEWIMKQEGVRSVIHYLDDFLVWGAPGSEECANALATVTRVFNCLGLPVAVEKLEGPATCLGFLGFEVDSSLMEVRLPLKKLQELRELTRQWLGRKTCTRKELESLVGKLAHAARVVRPGKTFMRRLFELLGGARKSQHHVRLSRPFRSDLQWWCMFMESWNGVSMIQQQHHGPAAVHIWTGASGHFGCGAFNPHTQAWIQLQWPRTYASSWLRLSEESIALKELLPIVLACAVWGGNWQGMSVTVHCDNLGVVALVNAGYSKVPQMMHIIRCLFFIRARFQLDLHAVHVPGVENVLADAISRDNLHILFTLVPGAVHRQTTIAPQLLSLLVESQPDWTSRHWIQLFRSCFPPGIAPSTRKNYQAGTRRYLSFCRDFNVQAPFPIVEQVALAFVPLLHRDGLSGGTVKNYCAAIRHAQISLEMGDPNLADMPCLGYAVKGMKRTAVVKSRPRLPITPAILGHLRAVWQTWSNRGDAAMLWSAATMCFFGFLRVGEIVVPSDQGFDGEIHLAYGDVRADNVVTPQYLEVRIKTDPFRKGVLVYLGKAPGPLCPVAVTLHYMVGRGTMGRAFFRFTDGKLLTRDRFVAAVRTALTAAGLDCSQYAGHSFRIGAATTAAANGLQDSLIKTLGWWESVVYTVYIRTPREVLCAASGSLVGSAGADEHP